MSVLDTYMGIKVLSDLLIFFAGGFLWIGVVMHAVPRAVQCAQQLCKSGLSHLICQGGIFSTIVYQQAELRTSMFSG